MSKKLQAADESTKLSIIDGDLGEIEDLLKKLNISPTDGAKVDFVCAILTGNKKLISGMTFDFDGTVEEIFEEVFSKPELNLTIGSFVAAGVARDSRNHREVVKFRQEYKKFCKWPERARVRDLGENYDFYFNVRSELLLRIREQFVYHQIPEFLVGKSAETARCYTPVHAGVFTSFITSFLTNKICPDVVEDPHNILNSCLYMKDGELQFRGSRHPCWGNLYAKFNPTKLACKKLRAHSEKMVKLVTTIKYLQNVFQISSSSKTGEFVAGNSVVNFVDIVKSKIHSTAGDWCNGINHRYLSMCGCSGTSNNNESEVSIENSIEKNICFHSKLNSKTLVEYRKLYHFYEECRILGGLGGVGKISHPDDFEDLTNFQDCPCVDSVGHSNQNIHQVSFKKNGLLAAHMISSKVLQNVVFLPEVIDINSVGTFDRRFEVVSDGGFATKLTPLQLASDRRELYQLMRYKILPDDFDDRGKISHSDGTFGQNNMDFEDDSVHTVWSDSTVGSVATESSSNNSVVDVDEIEPFKLSDLSNDFYQDLKKKDDLYVSKTYSKPEQYRDIAFRYHVCWNGSVIVICQGKRFDLPFKFRRFFQSGYIVGNEDILDGD